MISSVVILVVILVSSIIMLVSSVIILDSLVLKCFLWWLYELPGGYTCFLGGNGFPHW
jgi:hypothetical protein